MSRDDFLVERSALGEASPEEEAALRRDPQLVERVQQTEDDNALFHARFPAEEQLEAIQRKVHLANTREAVARRRVVLGGAGLLVPLAAAATVMLVAPELIVGEREIPMETRPKGLNPALAVHRKVDGSKPEALSSGTVASVGDVLQISYRSGNATHGVVLSIDGNGAVSLHFPESVAGNTRLDPDGFVELPHGYALDDAPRYERFFFVTDDAPIDARAVLEAAQALPAGDAATAPLALASELGQTSFLLRKAER